MALVLPNFTAVAPARFVPEMVTEVPPALGPEFGLTPVTVGAAETVPLKVTWSDGALTAEVPPGPVTLMSHGRCRSQPGRRR